MQVIQCVPRVLQNFMHESNESWKAAFRTHGTLRSERMERCVPKVVFNPKIHTFFNHVFSDLNQKDTQFINVQDSSTLLLPLYSLSTEIMILDFMYKTSYAPLITQSMMWA